MTPFAFTQRNNVRMNISLDVTLPGWDTPFDDIRWRSQMRQSSESGDLLLLDFCKRLPGEPQPANTLELSVEDEAPDADGHPRVTITFEAPAELLSQITGSVLCDVVAERAGRRDLAAVGTITFEQGVTR